MNPFNTFDEYDFLHLPAHLVSEGNWHELESLLTDLQFIEAKCAAGYSYHLQADYSESLSRWPNRAPWNPFGHPSEPHPSWVKSCVQAVLDGSTDPNPNLGCGPILAHLQTLGEPERYRGKQAAHYSEDGVIPDEYFGQSGESIDALANVRLATVSEQEGNDPFADPSPAGRVEAFASFVTEHLTQLESAPQDTIPIAHNWSNNGAVFDQATKLLPAIGHPWLARDPRPAVRPSRPLFLRRLEGHTDTIRALAITPDGRTVVSGGTDCFLRVWDAVTGQCRQALRNESGEIRGLALTPDGRLAVSHTGGADFRVWDVQDGKCLQISKGSRAKIEGLAISADGRIVLAVHEKWIVRVWDAESGRCLRELTDRGHKPQGQPSMTPDGRLAVTVGQDPEKDEHWADRILIRAVAMGPGLRVLSGHWHCVTSVQITPDGKLVIAGDMANKIRVWDVRSGRFLRQMHGPVDNMAMKLVQFAIMKDGTEKPIQSDNIAHVAVTPDGREVLTSSKFSRSVRLWNAVTGEYIRPLVDHEHVPSAIAISADGNVAFSTSGRTIYVWNIATGSMRPALDGHQGPVLQVNLSPEKKHACSAGNDGCIYLWDTKTGVCDRTLNLQKQSGPEDIAAGVGANRIVTLQSRTIEFWHMDAGDVQEASLPEGRLFRRVALSPDGSIAATAELDSSVGMSTQSGLRAWSFQTGSCLRAMDVQTREGVRELVLLPDQRTTFSFWRKDRKADLIFWDVVTGEVTWRFSLPGVFVQSAILSRDGGVCVTAGYDLAIRVWKIGSGRLLRTLWGHQDLIQHLVFSPDSRMLVSASNDGLLRIWDVKAGKCRKKLHGHRGKVLGTRISVDAQYMMSVGSDNTLRVWDLRLGECVTAYFTGASVSEDVDWDGCPIRSVSDLTAQGHVVCGTKLGEMHFLRLEGVQLGAPAVTAARAFSYLTGDLKARRKDPVQVNYPKGKRLAGADEKETGVDCPWCGARFATPRTVAEAISSFVASSASSFSTSACLTLPDNAWDDPRLSASCRRCSQPLRFNPFIFERLESSNDASEHQSEVACAKPASDDHGKATPVCALCSSDCVGPSSPERHQTRVGIECLAGALDSIHTEWAQFSGDGSAPCWFCDLNQRLPSLLTSVGWLCSDCIVELLKNQAASEDPSAWSLSSIKGALGPNSPLRWKLFVLWRLDSAFARMSSESPGDSALFLANLVQLLGETQERPLDPTVRYSALKACQDLGDVILPELLRQSQSSRKRSWIFHVNILIAATNIDAENALVRSLLEEAISDPEVEVRLRITQLLSVTNAAWVDTLMKKLALDPSESVRAQVRKAFDDRSTAEPKVSPPNRSETPPELLPPSHTNLSVLPRSACVAFAGRCAQWLEAQYRAWPEAPQQHVEFLHRARTAVQDLAAGRGMIHEDPALEDYVNDALIDAKAAKKDAEIAGDLDRLEHSTRAVLAAMGISCALRAAAATDVSEAVAESVKASLHAVEAAYSPYAENKNANQVAVVGALWLDYYCLKQLAERQKWQDNTPIGPDVFGTIGEVPSDSK